MVGEEVFMCSYKEKPSQPDHSNYDGRYPTQTVRKKFLFDSEPTKTTGCLGRALD